MTALLTRIRTSISRHPILFGVAALYVAVWSVYGLARGSDLVPAYLAWMIGAGLVVTYVDGRVRFSTYVLVILSASGFGHMAGGNLFVDSVLLYEHSWGVIGYDHLIHVLGLGGAGLAVQEATYRMLGGTHGFQGAVIAFLGANAVGAFIEIGEYLATLTVEAARVGGYDNNMQDLIANLIGSLLAAWWVARGRSPYIPDQ